MLNRRQPTPPRELPQWRDDLDEHDRVLRWRYRMLREAGYTRVESRWIADSAVDLHLAVELVTVRGCPHELAVEILT